MRWKHLTLLLTLPTALAFSLSDFQSLVDATLPRLCLSAYNTQMYDCQRRDFAEACSNDCITSLLSIQAEVQVACATVRINADSLLGIVKSSGIVEALCPGPRSTSTTTTTSRPIPRTTPPIPYPTRPSSSLSTTSSTSTKPTMPEAPKISPQPQPPPSSYTTSSTSSVGGNATTTTSSQPGAAATLTPTPKATPKPDHRSGGGSPFDNSSGGSFIELNPAWGAVLALFWTRVLLGR